MSYAAVDRELVREADDQAFSNYVDAWLRQSLSVFFQERKGHALDFQSRRSWEDGMRRAGWSGLGWPVRYGGLDIDLRRQALFHQRVALARAPKPVNFVGHNILGPTLLLHGTEAQRERFVPPLIRNEHLWCQGYSEPGAGSDLGSLATVAVADGDVYRVTGQKVWTTYAQYADWCFLLTRTGSPESRHRGLTFLLVPMNSAGIRVRPIRQITGDEEFCEVFFDDVEVPFENRVGAQDAGWHVAMTAANFERATYFIPHIARMRAEMGDLIELVHRRKATGDDVGNRLVDGYVNLRALELQAQEMLAWVESKRDPGAAGALIKLLWSESRQDLFELAMQLLGAQMDSPQDAARDWPSDYLRTRSETILAGTSEIQRNLIAERVLGLPR